MLLTAPFGHCHSSVGTCFDTAVGGVIGMPVLENITDEEGDKELADDFHDKLKICCGQLISKKPVGSINCATEMRKTIM